MHLFSNLQSESAKVLYKVNFITAGYKIKCNAMSMYLVILLNSLSHSALLCVAFYMCTSSTKQKRRFFTLTYCLTPPFLYNTIVFR